MKQGGAFLVLGGFILVWCSGAGGQESGPLAGFSRQMNLSLAQATEVALANNPDLRGERLNLEMAKTDLVRARAAYDPYVQVDSSYSKREQPSAQAVFGTSSESASLNLSTGMSTITGGSLSLDFRNSRSESDSLFSTLNPSYNTDVSLNLRQPLLKNRWTDQRRMDLDQGSNDLKNAELSLKSRTLETGSQVEDAYWSLVRARLDIGVRRQSVEVSEHLLAIAQAQVRTGLAAPVSTIQSQANLASAQAGLIRSENDYRKSQNNLKLILNLTPEQGLWDLELVPTDLPPEPAGEVAAEQVMREALANNIALLQLGLNLANSEIDNYQTKNRLLPQLDLRASIGLSGLSGTDNTGPQLIETGFVIPNPLPTPPPYMVERTTVTPDPSPYAGDYGDALQNLGTGDNLNWSAGLTFNIPIGNRAARSDWKRARLNLERMKIEQAKQARNVIFTIQNLLSDFTSAQRNLEAASLAAKLQQQNLETEGKRFELGLSTQYDVMQAQESYNDAKTSEIGSRIELAKASARIERARQGYVSAGGVGGFTLPAGLTSGLNLGSLAGLPSGISPGLLQQYSSMLPAGIDLNALQSLGISLP
jgi:outer membrane protein TolC